MNLGISMGLLNHILGQVLGYESGLGVGILALLRAHALRRSPEARTHLSTTVPNNCNPGKISLSGTEVSTMVDTSAIQTSLAATLCEADTAAM